MGTAYCGFAALGYTLVNMCLCSLAKSADQVWTLWIKESVAVTLIGSWLLYQGCRRPYVAPPLKVVASLVAVGLAVQLVGNLGLLWAFGVVGLTVTIPLVYAVNLVGSAVLGQAILGERVSPQSAVAIGSLILSIALLQLGAGAADAGATEGPSHARLAVAAACLAGAVYAVLNISLRKTVANAVSPTTAVLVITATGTVALGLLGLWRQGLQGLTDLPAGQLRLILLAGTLNVFSFLAYTKALRVITVVRANVLNAAQVALAAIGGVLFFSEKPNVLLITGVCLTIVGIFLIERPTQ